MSCMSASSLVAATGPLDLKDSIAPSGNTFAEIPFANVEYAREVPPVICSPYWNTASLVGFINAWVLPFVPVTTAVAPEVLPVIVSPIWNCKFALAAVSRSDSNWIRSVFSYVINSTPSVVTIESSGRILNSLKVNSSNIFWWVYPSINTRDS